VPSTRPKTRVYIDGFNFYYAAFRRGRFADFKWLDLVQFCESALPENDVELVRFFTARLEPTRGRAAQRARQDVYLAALATLPRLSIHYGEFVEHAKRRQRVHPRPGESRTTDVWVAEEKGSDVNLASHLLLDAFRDTFDVAVVVSNDADLLEPVRMAREELGKTVGVLRVEGGQRRCIFAGRVDFIRTVRGSHFAAAQLPRVVAADGRHYSKPASWGT
jgi:uncharacterized LabA/DUF88 family protein